MKIILIILLLFISNCKLNKVVKHHGVNFLDQNGSETRPIISGNFLNHRAAKLYKLNKDDQ